MNEGRGSTTFNRIGKYMNEWKTSEWVDCLQAGEVYKFRVIAINSVGESTPSNPSDEMECSGVPEKPYAPYLVKNSSKSIEIEWVAPDNGGSKITGYIL